MLHHCATYAQTNREFRWQVVDARRSVAWRHLLGEAALDGGSGTGVTVELRILAQGNADAAALQVLCLASVAFWEADTECITCALKVYSQRRIS